MAYAKIFMFFNELHFYGRNYNEIATASLNPGGRAIRRSGPSEGPSDSQSIRNVRHSQWPPGPRRTAVRAGTGPGTLRRPGAVTEAGSPHEAA